MNQDTSIRTQGIAAFSLNGGSPNLESKKISQAIIADIMSGANVSPLLSENLQGLSQVSQVAGRSFGFAMDMLGGRNSHLSRDGKDAESRVDVVLRLVGDLKDLTKFAFTKSENDAAQNTNDNSISIAPSLSPA